MIHNKISLITWQMILMKNAHLIRLFNAGMKYGFDGKKFIRAIKSGNRWVRRDLKELERQKGSDTTFPMGTKRFIISDKTDQAGIMKGHYFHQDLFVAQEINKAKPSKHLDIGSRTDGFVAHVAAFREIELIDIRKLKSQVKNITFRQGDLLKLPPDLVNYCDSISSLHALEHFGLGRYGDPIDYFGYLKAIQNITKILKPSGRFYFSVPIGPQRIEFNAHRVFNISYLMELFKEDYEIQSFSYVDDAGEFHPFVPLTTKETEENYGCSYGCGIFILKKN